jgi:hypothetical protein
MTFNLLVMRGHPFLCIRKAHGLLDSAWHWERAKCLAGSGEWCGCRMVGNVKRMKFFDSAYGHFGFRGVQNCVVLLVGRHQVVSKKCLHIKGGFLREGVRDIAPLSERYKMVNCA